MKFVVAVSLIYLTTIVGPGTSLQCYTCGIYTDSSEREKCMDPFFRNSSLLRNCSSWDIGCAKYEAIGVTYITKRGCVSYSDLKLMKEAQRITSDNVEYCETDGCNNSQSLESSVAVMVFTAAVVKCLLYGLRL